MNKEKQIEEMAVEILEEYTNCYSEVDQECLEKMLSKLASDVAREIFEEIDKVLNFYKKYNPYNDLLKCVIDRIAELKKKYTESEKDNG